jgi:hypothetical protein
MPARRVLMVRRHHSIAQIPEYGAGTSVSERVDSAK